MKAVKVLFLVIFIFTNNVLAKIDSPDKDIKFVTSSIRDEFFFIHPKQCKFIEGKEKEWQNSIFYCLKLEEIQILSSQISNDITIDYYIESFRDGYDVESFGKSAKINKITTTIFKKENVGRMFLSGADDVSKKIWKTVAYKVVGENYFYLILAAGEEKNAVFWKNLEAFLSYIELK